MVSAPALAADKLCSGEGSDRHVLEYRDGSFDFAIRHNGKLVRWIFENSGGTGVPARLFKNDDGEEAVTLSAEAVLDENSEPPVKRNYTIFQGRAYEPCR